MYILMLTALLSYLGQDATAEFEDHQHSQDARELAKSYLIGYISKVTINGSCANCVFCMQVAKTIVGIKLIF